MTDGEDSILKFEEWLDTDEQALLDWIQDYNEEDCRLHAVAPRLAAWAPSRVRTAIRRRIPWRPVGETKPTDNQLGEGGGRGAPVETPRGRPGRARSNALRIEHARWLLAQLIDYHRREESPTGGSTSSA